jgi:hypothetical protein
MALRAPQALMFFNGFSSVQAIKHWQKNYGYVYIMHAASYAKFFDS